MSSTVLDFDTEEVQLTDYTALPEAVRVKVVMGLMEGVMPPKGKTGQVLVKASDADYDVAWKDQNVLTAKQPLPALATYAEENIVMFYIGDTTENFTHNSFYTCVIEEDVPQWKQLFITSLPTEDSVLTYSTSGKIGTKALNKFSDEVLTQEQVDILF